MFFFTCLEIEAEQLRRTRVIAVELEPLRYLGTAALQYYIGVPAADTLILALGNVCTRMHALTSVSFAVFVVKLILRVRTVGLSYSKN